MQINRAHQENKQYANKPFGFDNCHKILKDLPKFDPTTTRINTQHYSSDGNQTSSPSTPTDFSNINFSEDSPIDIESELERPPRRKGEKQRQKRESRANSVSANSLVIESVEKFTKQYAKSVGQNQQAKMCFKSQMQELIQI